MSENYTQLSQSITALEDAANKATARLALTENTFQWFETRRSHPMEPQTIIPDESAVEMDTYRSHVSVYGGAFKAHGDRFAYGIVNADIAEAMPEGRKHISGSGSVAVPYIPRLLTVTPSEVTVDTPFQERDEALQQGEGIIYHEGTAGYGGRSRVTTIFKRNTQEMVAVTGSTEAYTDGRFIPDAKEYTVLEADSSVALGRLAIMQRTLEEATSILNDVQRRGDFYMPPGTAYCTFA